MRFCREKIRKVKAQMEFNLVTAEKKTIKMSLKIHQKDEAKKNNHPLLDVGGNMDTKHKEKIEVVNLPQALPARSIVLLVPSSLSWEAETGSRMKAS